MPKQTVTINLTLVIKTAKNLRPGEKRELEAGSGVSIDLDELERRLKDVAPLASYKIEVMSGDTKLVIQRKKLNGKQLKKKNKKK